MSHIAHLFSLSTLEFIGGCMIPRSIGTLLGRDLICFDTYLSEPNWHRPSVLELHMLYRFLFPCKTVSFDQLASLSHEDFSEKQLC